MTLSTLEGHESTVWSISWEKAGNRLASVSDDKTLKIWKRFKKDSLQNNYDWKCVCTVSGFHDRAIYTVDWCHITGLIATGCGDNCIRIFSEEKEGEEHPIFNLFCSMRHAHPQDINSVCWNPVVKGILATASDDDDVKIWKVNVNEM